MKRQISLLPIWVAAIAAIIAPSVWTGLLFAAICVTLYVRTARQ